jgi:hypothetical protein
MSKVKRERVYAYEPDVVVEAMAAYGDFMVYCENRGTCIGCHYRVSGACEVMSPRQFIILVGTYAKIVKLKRERELKKSGG